MTDLKRIPTFLDTRLRSNDEFFSKLDHILLPLSNYPFENEAISVALMIARKFGSSITILHVGQSDLSDLIQSFKAISLHVAIQHYSDIDPAEAILAELQSNEYQLLIMPSRRRFLWLNRFRMNTVSSRVIPVSPCDSIQVYPARKPTDQQVAVHEFKKVCVFLPRSERDLKLIYYANCLIQSNSRLHAYHFSDLPIITTYRDALDADYIIKEKKEFSSITKTYSSIFSTRIKPHFIIAHDIVKGASTYFNTEGNSPDIILIGQSRTKPWYKMRFLSDKLIDVLQSPILVHFYGS